MLIISINIMYHHNHQYCLTKCRSFAANAGTKVAVLPEGRSSTANSGTKIAVLLGISRCCSFPLFSAPQSLFSIRTDIKDLKRFQGLQRGGEENGFGQLGPPTSPKFTTRVKYQFHQGFLPDQRSGNPNHPSPPTLYIS